MVGWGWDEGAEAAEEVCFREEFEGCVEGCVWG
jgi:hypothetical protein